MLSVQCSVFSVQCLEVVYVFWKQPVPLIICENAGSRWYTRSDEMIGGAAKKVLVPKGTHMDFYTQSDYAGSAVNEVVECTRKN